MKYGCAHTNGLYNYPDDGNQFANGCDAIWDMGCRTLKVYCTSDYLTNYPEQAAWSSTPTNLTQLAQTTQFATQLARGWDTIIMTCFTFANGSTNWWRVEATNAKLAAEYTEIYNLAVHLLTSYNNSGTKFVLQNWEGDWAYMDAFDPDTFVDRKYTEFYAAFAAVRQKAVHDAMRNTAHKNVSVRMAFEINRVLDTKSAPARVRIINTLAKRFTPDIVSYSWYEATDAVPGWSSQGDFEALVETQMREWDALVQLAWPGVTRACGEFGYPENQIVAEFPQLDVGDMINKVASVSVDLGLEYLVYWQCFDNEASIPYTYRGYWFVKPDGSQSLAGAAFEALASGG